MAAWSGPTSCATRIASFANTLNEDASVSRADASQFCAPPDSQHYLAAIGIFTVDDHKRHRESVRASWMRSASRANMIAKFVLHGLSARADVLKEAAAHGDTIYLKAPAVMSCKSGPLKKLLLWLECALTAWPNAELIGKADDDTWAHLPGIAAHVARSLAALRARHVSTAANLLVWGSIESYHWHEGVHRPVGFTGMRYAFRRLPGDGRLEKCRRRKSPRLVPLPNRDVPKAWHSSEAANDAEGANVTGPYFYAKGPFYLVGSSLVQQVINNQWARKEAEASLESGEREADLVELTWPWEDVWLGAAITHSASADQQPAVVHIGATRRAGSVFSEEWGIKAAPSTLIWHMRTKDPERLHTLERWSERWRCDRQFESMEYCSPYIACSGATWHACEHALPTRKERQAFDKGLNCSDRLDDVTQLLKGLGSSAPAASSDSVQQPQMVSTAPTQDAGVKPEAWRTLELLPDVTSEEIRQCSSVIDQGGWDVSTAPLVLLAYASHISSPWLLGLSASMHNIPLVIVGLGGQSKWAWYAGGTPKLPASRRAPDARRAANNVCEECCAG